LLKDGIATFDEFELWYWHAYTYAFRRVALNVFDFVSPIDPEGRWYGDDQVRAAERYYRKRLGKQARPFFPKPSSPDAIRTDCRKISAHDLTPAEHKLIDPEIAVIRSRALIALAALVRRWRSAYRDPNTSFEARDGIERPVTPAYTDPLSPAELLASLGASATEHKPL
jgi:hypothetical protein